MLEELSVRNYALIDSLNLSFEGGFNVLTGETGAGKSIIVGALGFLLGAKADTDVVRSGCDEAGVSAVVSLNKVSREALEWLKARDIETEDDRLVIRRSLKTSGRTSIYLQNIPLTRSDLAEFTSLIFDLHGQHAHESLLKKESHRKYLDRFAGLEDETSQFNAFFLELADKRKILEASLNSERDRDTRLEVLTYALEEIDKAVIKNGESRALEAEAQRLGDFEKLISQVNMAAESLFDDEASALVQARRAKNAMDNAAAIDADLAPLLQRMENLYYEAEDLSGEFRSYRDGLSYDPNRLEEVEERLALLYRLKKKYARAPGQAPVSENAEEVILAYRESAAAEIENLTGAGENREKLKADISALEKELVSRAAKISAKRKAEAAKLGDRITAILSRLGMPKARFSAAVRPKGQAEGQAAANAGANAGANLRLGPWGADDVEFMISANAGEPERELARIASGGELSRVMLAIKTILSDSDGGGGDSPDTLVFDEIDTGIGGEVALAVGEYLAQIGGRKQIFCVTHLASIAVRADNHLMVEKHLAGGEGRTVTGVTVLSKTERRREIARMLAGGADAAALAHADELLTKYGSGRGKGGS
ncbi:DNA repair protein RecN [Spirochaetia bacterium]|nr:DNA repair protein RecN [Spirochaetia bacterium]